MGRAGTIVPSRLLPDEWYGAAVSLRLRLRLTVLRQGLSETSFLDTHLRAGLAALKTEFCGSATQSISDCPVCTQDGSAALLTVAPLPH